MANGEKEAIEQTKSRKTIHKEMCPNCSNWYVELGTHWANSSTCGYPELDNRLKTVATLAARLYPVRTPESVNHNPYVVIHGAGQYRMGPHKIEVWLEELEWLAGEIGYDRRHAQGKDAVYWMQTKRHPFFRNFCDYNDIGEK